MMIMATLHLSFEFIVTNQVCNPRKLAPFEFPAGEKRDNTLSENGNMTSIVFRVRIFT